MVYKPNLNDKMTPLTKEQKDKVIDLFTRNRPLTDLTTYLFKKCNISISEVGLGRWLKRNGYVRKAIPKRKILKLGRDTL